MMKAILLPILMAGAVTGAATAQEVKPAPVQAPAEDAAKEVKKPTVYTVGTQVPKDLVLTDIDGKTLSMKELRGKTVVVTWYAMNCPAIKATVDRLKAMAKEFEGDKDVVLIAINSDKNELADAKPTGVDKDGKPIKPYAAIRKYMKDKKINFRMFVDPGNKIADRFQAKTTPHMFVIDGKGIVRYSGALDNDMRMKKEEKDYRNYVTETVEAIKANRLVTTTNTKPYG